jgi:tetratricopeptide (TPR) repeat protein
VIVAALSLWFALAPPQVSTAMEHVRAGVEAHQSGQLDSAIAEFQQATELDPQLALAFVDLGAMYVEKRDFGAAIAPLKRALELNPNVAGAHQLLGYALLGQGYPTEAIPHFEQAHDDDTLGIALLEAGDYARAVPLLQKSLAKNPNDPDLLYDYGRASGLLSKQVFDDLEARFPNSPRSHQMMAQNYAALRDVPNAEKEYREALRLRPEISGLHLELGEVYARAQQWDQAEQEYRAETQIQPGNAEAAYRLGEALVQEGKFHDARVALSHSDQLKPDMPETLYMLGKAASLDGDGALAERSWKRVLDLEKGTPLVAQAHFSLSGLYRKQGKAQQAAHEMEEFRALSKAGQTPEPPQ